MAVAQAASPTSPFSDMIHLAKGLGIIAVVVGHVEVPSLQPAWWQPLRDVIYTFHMPLFMLLSGYLFARSRDPVASLGDYGRLLKKKARRLMVPYLTLTGLIAGIKLPAGLWVELRYPVDAEAWRYVLLNPTGGFATLLWFIYTLFIIFAVFPLLRAALRVDLLVLAAAVGLAFIPWPEALCLNHVFRHLPFFSLGYALARRVPVESLRPIPAGILAAVCLAAFAFWKTGLFQAWPEPLPALALGTAGSLACLIAASGLARWGAPRVLIRLGAYSAGIYLMHTLGMGPVKVFFFQVLKLGSGHFLWVACLMCAAGLGLPILVERLILRRQPVLAGLILGQPVRNARQ